MKWRHATFRIYVHENIDKMAQRIFHELSETFEKFFLFFFLLLPTSKWVRSEICGAEGDRIFSIEKVQHTLMRWQPISQWNMLFIRFDTEVFNVRIHTHAYKEKKRSEKKRNEMEWNEFFFPKSFWKLFTNILYTNKAAKDLWWHKVTNEGRWW